MYLTTIQIVTYLHVCYNRLKMSRRRAVTGRHEIFRLLFLSTVKHGRISFINSEILSLTYFEGEEWTVEFSALTELFKTRRSIRKWQAVPVPEDLLIRAVEAAVLSPNGGGKQTYKCYIITNADKIAELGSAVQAVSDYLASLCKDDADIEIVERWRANSSFFAKAPAVIAVSALMYQSIADKIQASNLSDARVAEINRGRQVAASRIQTVGAFVDHLLLALHSLGLGAVWMAGPAQAKAQVEKIIGMKDDEDFAALVPVGYPAEQPDAPKRKPLSEIVTFIR